MNSRPMAAAVEERMKTATEAYKDTVVAVEVLEDHNGEKMIHTHHGGYWNLGEFGYNSKDKKREELRNEIHHHHHYHRRKNPDFESTDYSERVVVVVVVEPQSSDSAVDRTKIVEGTT